VRINKLLVTLAISMFKGSGVAVTGTHFGKEIKTAQSDDVKIVVEVFKNGQVLI